MGTIMINKSVKLYEYEGEKPSIDDAILHFGILGMRWGQRNGPPYPLGSDKSTGRRLKKAAVGGSSDTISKKKKAAVKKAQKTRTKNQKIKTLEAEKKEKVEKTKEEIIKNKDIKSMLNNVDMFTKTDIENMLNRLDTEKRLKEAVAKQEYANKTNAQKIKEGIKSAAKEGMASAGKKIVKTVAGNALKIGTQQMAIQLKRGDPEWEQLIRKLFKEDKK